MLIFKDNKIMFSDDQFENAINVCPLCVSYTLKTENIKKQKRVECTPYVSRKDFFDENGYASETQTSLTVEQVDGGLEFLVSTKSTALSEFGIYLPFNFMSKLGGGDWKRQYLLNSPYKSIYNEHIYVYFSSPSGRNLIVVAQSPIDGWKMDYSPYVGGHFFDNFKLLANFDRAYKTKSKRSQFSFSVFEVKDFNEAQRIVAKRLNLPVATYVENGGEFGKEIDISVFGECDSLLVGTKTYPVVDGKAKVKIDFEGDCHVIPFFKGKKGLDCTVYGYKSVMDLYKKAMDSVSFSDIKKTDGNLCEHQCWVSAMLRFMLKQGKNEEYERKVKLLLDVVTEKDEKKARHDITIFDKPQNGYPAYHIYKSNRIQEQFFGITILLDAFKYFGREEYLIYAENALDTALSIYQKQGGGLIRYSDYYKMDCDYSTVCCPMIPIVDMANFYKDKDQKKYEKYKNSASMLAEHLFNRGYSFPTETEETDQATEEMEDGSISCTALSLLYYCANVQNNQAYVNKALEILSVHEAWVANTPISQIYHSSLRWWETRWEGDKDGPALCMAHGWSIWRAEADYWAYVLTGEEKYRLGAMGGFTGNFAKIDKKGKSYAIYHADYIVGGGFMKGIKIKYRPVKKFPRQSDSGLSRYVWIRAAETILK